MIRNNLGLLSIIICYLVLISPFVVYSSEIPWKVQELVKDGRIDAIAYLGNSTLICGTRSPNPGWIYYSKDNGLNWTKGQRLNSSQMRTGVTCLASAGNGLCYAINESSEFFRSQDYGATWGRVNKISFGASNGGKALSYGLTVSKHGTILISDTDSSGGYVYRSTDKGKTFKKIGPISPNALYRFEIGRDAVFLNGWHGSVYKSTNDGQDWNLLCRMDSSTALYATEYIRPETIIQASESGYIYKVNQDSKGNFTVLSKPGGAADDFVSLGYNSLIYTTYTHSKSVFISYNDGKTWIDDGPIPTEAKGDWLDHVISVDMNDSVIVIGGTNKGFIARAAYSRSDLYTRTLDPQKSNYLPELRKDFEIGLIGSLYDPKELDEPEDVLIDGDLAYVPCRGSNNLAVIDISNPKKPNLLSSFRDPELLDAMGVTKFKNYIYISSFSNSKCIVVDASNPKSLKKIYSFTVGAGGPGADKLRKVVYHDGYLYLTHDDESKLYIADARSPSRPKVISSVSTGDDGTFAVFIKGNYAYTGGCFSAGPVKVGRSLRVIDVTDKMNPKLISTLTDSVRYGCICSFQEYGDKLISIGYSSNSLIAFDISIPLKTSEIGYLHSDQIYGPNRVVVMDKKAYLINSINNTFVQIDITTPENPTIDYVAPSWKLKKVYGMAGKNGLLYMAGRDSRIFSVVDPKLFK